MVLKLQRIPVTWNQSRRIRFYFLSKRDLLAASNAPAIVNNLTG
jgi:hypothetical protein